MSKIKKLVDGIILSNPWIIIESNEISKKKFKNNVRDMVDHGDVDLENLIFELGLTCLVKTLEENGCTFGKEGKEV